MTHPNPSRTGLRRGAEFRRRTTALVVAVLVGTGLSSFLAAPAAGAEVSVGYVRLAHLSPDTPQVDVYLSKVGDASFKEQIFTHVGYGIMSKYLALPVGTYAIAMRLQGDPASNPPVLTTQATVESGKAYTVAGTGKFAGLGLKVLVDDLTRPDAGMAKVRIIQASVVSPVLDVSLTDGTQIAQAVSFASTTAYQVIKPGTWTLRLKPNGSAKVSELSASLAAGSVYSLLVLDGPSGLKLELRADARGGATAPDGSVETGGGGPAPATNPGWLLAGVSLLIVVGLTAVALRLRRTASRRS